MERVIYADECWIADPEVFKVNREEAHSDHAFYEEKVTEYGLDMPLRQSLNGTWKFSYADVPDKRVKDFYEENFDISGFSDIKVPGHIELAGYDTCQYINVMYPWEGHENLRPPFVPAKHNPVGSYVTYFDVDEALLGKKTYISFQGVEKAYAIQAGREVRVMVKPEQVNEDQMVILARDLAKKIEEEMEYPGQIKVHVLRETTAIEYAK